MRLSDRLLSLKPSATMAVSTKAMELRALGREIISLSVGEPDFGTPEHVKDAAKKALDENFTRYTQVPGIPELREAVADYFNRTYKTSAKNEETIVTNGGKQALFNLFQCLLNPGDEVIIPTPYWVSYPAMVELAGGKPVYVPTEAEADYKMTVDQVRAAISSKTRLLILNSPSNPTGAAYTQDELNAIAAACFERDVFVVSDEIYDQLVYPPAEPASLAPIYAEEPERVCVVNGLAKSHAMTGWRVGYALAHPELIKALSKIQGQSTSNICSIAQKAAVAALNGPWEPVLTMREAFAHRRDLAHGIVSGWEKVVCPRPDGAFYLFPDVSAYYTAACPDSATLCTLALERVGVAMVPGAAFGDNRCVRLSYAVDETTLKDALDKVQTLLTEL